MKGEPGPQGSKVPVETENLKGNPRVRPRQIRNRGPQSTTHRTLKEKEVSNYGEHKKEKKKEENVLQGYGEAATNIPDRESWGSGAE